MPYQGSQLTELQDEAHPDTIPLVSAHRCMIVGLKYAGASDGFPMRIGVGDTIKLRLEGAEVSAYHNDKKVGYLSPDKRRLWNSLRPSARSRAKVVGEITDEDGNIAGLDVEISERSSSMPRAAGKGPASLQEVQKTDSASRSYRASIGLAVLLASIAVMGHVNSAGPDRFAAAASLVPLNSSLQPFLEEEQELRRQVQLTSAHRLADDMRRREAEAKLKLETEAEKARVLQAALERAQEASALQLKKIEKLEAQARQAAAQQEAESGKLNTEIAALQQKLDQLAAKQQKVEDEKKHAAWQTINAEELVRHRNQLAAWTVMSRVEQLKAVLKNKTVLEQVKPEVRAVSVPRNEPRQQVEKSDTPDRSKQAERSEPADKSSKQAEETPIRKKTNFSRYAQENDEATSGVAKR